MLVRARLLLKWFIKISGIFIMADMLVFDIVGS